MPLYLSDFKTMINFYYFYKITYCNRYIPTCLWLFIFYSSNDCDLWCDNGGISSWDTAEEFKRQYRQSHDNDHHRTVSVHSILFTVRTHYIIHNNIIILYNMEKFYQTSKYLYSSKKSSEYYTKCVWGITEFECKNTGNRANVYNI